MVYYVALRNPSPDWPMFKRLQHSVPCLINIIIVITLTGCTVSQAAEPTPPPSSTWTPIPVVQAITPTASISTIAPRLSPSATPTDQDTITPSVMFTDTTIATT